MASDYVFLKGKAKWFKHSVPDAWGNWKVDLYPIPESLEKVRDLLTSQHGVNGIKNILKKDEDGYYITFKRPTSKTMKNKVVGFAPPVVVDATKPALPDGSYSPLPHDTMVGNGSDVTIKIEVYTHGTPGGGKAKAARWDSARIDNLVPYEGKKDMTEDQLAQLEGMDAQPKATFDGF